MRALVFLSFLFLSLSGMGQSYRTVTGKVMDGTTGEGLPYAVILESGTGRSTITNESGEFQMNILLSTDTLRISYLGYRSKKVPIADPTEPLRIELTEEKQVLNEVMVTPPSSEVLIDLLRRIQRNRSQERDSAKCYYELKTWVNQAQVELVEGFYNGRFQGYDILDLNLKSGRLGWRPFGNQFFASLESSRALAMWKMTGPNDFFPRSPLELNRRSIRQYFVLSAQGTYTRQDGDSILVLRFAPKDTTGVAFEGEYTINVTREEVEKARLSSSHAKDHPFLPLFVNDTIRRVDLEISRTYQTGGDRPLFSHTELIYTIHYINRQGFAYSARTEAVLFSFDRSKTFLLPQFRFLSRGMTDYQRIQLTPFNREFWERQASVRFVDRQRSNQRFLAHPATLSSEFIFKEAQNGNGFFEFPYLHWTDSTRLGIKEIESVTPRSNDRALISPRSYHIGCGILMDASPSISGVPPRTHTIIDPYSTYRSGAVDSLFLCAVNIYIDLVEIERRELQKQLNEVPLDRDSILNLYHRSKERVDALRKEYFSFVELGANIKVMADWNERVLDEVGRDHMAFFRIPKPE
ncbi:MAG: carboxypeptidase-like regulatory domain-containing protein [Bacteroidota bacterium]|nr:carboxypeptidase-like regulatory domain-containing protein [Bacteroidota bacterium]